jgi:hypothetical protein
MAITTYAANKILDHQLGKTSWTMPTIHVGLSYTTPAINGTGVTEPSGGAYARVATTGSTWTAAAAGSTSNAADITFPTATADWGSTNSMTHALLYDASTGGNLLGYCTLSTARQVLNGNIAKLAVGALVVTLT